MSTDSICRNIAEAATMATYRVRVKPNAKKQAIETVEDGSLLVHLKSPPVDGKANAELVQVLAKQFKVSKSQITIKSGAASRYKWVEVNEG